MPAVGHARRGRIYARRISFQSTSSTTAPAVAVMIDAMNPPPM
ncbi:hypothetical protein GWC77_04400 [Paraburkholderia sp. NMBU_R16]|nr:hypothetical protein [Paraburkholderia sp. NMBU_R16]